MPKVWNASSRNIDLVVREDDDEPILAEIATTNFSFTGISSPRKSVTFLLCRPIWSSTLGAFAAVDFLTTRAAFEASFACD